MRAECNGLILCLYTTKHLKLLSHPQLSFFCSSVIHPEKAQLQQETAEPYNQYCYKLSVCNGSWFSKFRRLAHDLITVIKITPLFPFEGQIYYSGLAFCRQSHLHFPKIQSVTCILDKHARNIQLITTSTWTLA